MLSTPPFKDLGLTDVITARSPFHPLSFLLFSTLFHPLPPSSPLCFPLHLNSPPSLLSSTISSTPFTLPHSSPLSSLFHPPLLSLLSSIPFTFPVTSWTSGLRTHASLIIRCMALTRLHPQNATITPILLVKR